ncbi:MAG TPA: alpha/beta fold hydrolase [Chloroflexota bacterium]|nr:alpha/beta fold hydrolase [Chloroflexota bacterium]
MILVHGFPELWYSYRHQLPALGGAGFHAVAPDLRGYGESDAPEPVESYSLRNQMADIIGLMDALGAERAALVGHDVGAGITWALTELFPHRVAAHVGLGVPYGPRPPAPPVERTRQFAGQAFSFLDYFTTPGRGEADLDAAGACGRRQRGTDRLPATRAQGLSPAKGRAVRPWPAPALSVPRRLAAGRSPGVLQSRRSRRRANKRAS